MNHIHNPRDPLFEPLSKFDVWMAEIGMQIMQEANASKVCYICGRKDELQNHHIIPKFFGGLDVRENKVKLCPYCHNQLHNFNDHHWSERYWLERLVKLKNKSKHLNSSNNMNRM